MTKTPDPASATAASIAPATSKPIDPDVLAAVLQQLAADGNTGRPIVNVPSFVYDAAEPNSAALWFSRLQSLFRLHKFSDEEKVAMAVNALDGQTYKKVHRALLPDDIATLTDFKKLQTVMVGLFDRHESVFARRYSSYQMEWKGPEHESIAEYCSRVRECVSACDPANFGEVQYETMVLIMGMRHPALEIFRNQALNLLNKDPDTTMDKIQDAMTATLRTQADSKLPMGTFVNYVKMNSSSRAKKHRKRSDSSSSANSRASNTSSTSSKRGACDSCGGSHRRSTCRFRDAECYKCGGSGHIEKVCISKRASSSKHASTSKSSRPRVNAVTTADPPATYTRDYSKNKPSGHIVPYQVNNVQAAASPSKSYASVAASLTSLSFNDATTFHRGDSVQWYYSYCNAWLPGHITHIHNTGMVEIKSGQMSAILNPAEVFPYDPSKSPASPAKVSSTVAASKRK